ncbi:MAG: hypothetical protein ACR2PG_12230 [Hyphomicrobiaceae bacterium]
MSSATNSAPRRVTLDAFLVSIPDTDTEPLRIAAAKIDDLEVRAQPVRGIERRLAPWFAISAVAFVVGLTLFTIGTQWEFAPRVWINDLAITILLGFLPLLCVYYAFCVRGRSRADAEAFDLNQKYFAPHGCIYFARDCDEASCVVIVDPDRAWRPRASKFDHVKPGMIW